MDFNLIKKNAYFIRLTDNKNYFIHFENETSKKLEYVVKEGNIGAAIWKETEGNNFIKESGANNLEMVKVTEILKP